MEKFSFYNAPITNVTPLKSVTLKDVAEMTRSSNGGVVQRIRNEKNKEKRNRLKAKLDYVTFSGEFTRRKNDALVRHSGLICVDIDNVEINKTEIIEKYKPALLFTSPSGNGLKIVYKIDISQATHIEYFESLKDFFLSQFNLKIDSCQDVSRACYLSYDPDVFYSDTPYILDQNFCNGFAPGNRNNYVFNETLELTKKGVPEKEAINELVRLAEKDFPKTEIENIVKKVYKEVPKNVPYIRIGTNYFKIVKKPDRYNVERTELKIWNKDTLIQDYKRRYLNFIPRYDDFCMVPSNANYKAVINNCYNLYSKFDHKPAAGDWAWTQRLLEHVFGDQYELGLRYMQILYMHPNRSTVILVLVSKERGTGKTTFLNWINMLFGANVAFLSSSDFTSGFNFSYATKNIICIEETLLEKRLTIEKLKSLVTAKNIQVNEKYVSQYKIPFYGKVILTSNNVDKFALIDPEEDRFFVRKLGMPKFVNHNIETDLLKEIPAFLHHLETLSPVDWKISRSAFKPEELANENLQAVVEESRSGLYKDLKAYITDFFDNNDVDEFLAAAVDIKKEWYNNNHRIDLNYIRRVIKTEFEIEPEVNQRYIPFADAYSKVGTPFKFLRSNYTTEKIKEDEVF